MPPKSKTPMSAKIRADMFGASFDLPRIIEIELSKIVANPDQPRQFFDDDGLIELAQSIEMKGLLQPILVKVLADDQYMVVAGERRFKAHQLLSRPTIPAVITDGDIDEIAIIENVQREDLRPMELAESLSRLMQTHSYTQEDVAKIIGKARSTVTELLSLLKLPDSIRQECRTSDMASKSFLIELSRMDEAALGEAWDAFKSNGETTVRSVRTRKATPAQVKGESGKQNVSAFQRVEKSLAVALGELDKSELTMSADEVETITSMAKKLNTHLARLQSSITR